MPSGPIVGRHAQISRVVPHAVASPEKREPDPESFEDIAEGNVLVKLAAALLIALAVFALVLALT
jgi:hypothetical protein